MSLNYIYEMIKNIEFERLANSPHREELIQVKDLLSTIFTKLCFSENDNDISEIVETSEIIPVKDFNFFKKGSRLVPENDKRFHYEDDILEPEPLDTPEKNFEPYKIQTELAESDNSDPEQRVKEQ